jgi:hypothetical protein
MLADLLMACGDQPVVGNFRNHKFEANLQEGFPDSLTTMLFYSSSQTGCVLAFQRIRELGPAFKA